MRVVFFGGPFNERILYSVPDYSNEVKEDENRYERTDSLAGSYRVFIYEGRKTDDFFEVVEKWRRWLTATGFDSGPKRIKFRTK